MLICTFVSGSMDGCMHVNMYTVSGGMDRCMYLTCTLIPGCMDCCMYVNMYIGIWWYGQLYVC
jgi:hypothetical protein